MFFQSLTVTNHSSDQYHVWADSERPFLADKQAFPYLRRALAHLRRALAILRCSGDLTCGHFHGCCGEAEKPKISLACLYGPVDRLPYRSPPVTLNGHWGVIFQSIFKPNISLERSCPDLNEHVLFMWIRRETAEQRPFEVCRRIDFAIDQRLRLL